VNTFEFSRYRIYFRAIDPVHFPRGKGANMLRGALGVLLRETAAPDVYTRLFEPGAALRKSPSGLGDWPRPYLFRASHLDGLTTSQGGRFYFDLHVFDLSEPVLEPFRAAFLHWGETGIGPRRGRVALEHIEQIGFDDRPSTSPCVVTLDRTSAETVQHVRLRFLTPTELKNEGVTADRPEFPILFARLRDRIGTLRALYGAGALEIDFREIGERARAKLERADLTHHEVFRKSGRTGQIHPLGGFTGTADYIGDLGEFVPWLRAARWVGVGRHTAWGNGDVRVVIPREAPEPGPPASPGEREAS
jgi:hypothetical protein